MVHNRGSHFIGRYYIFVETVFLILFEGLPAYSCSIFPFPWLVSRYTLGDQCHNEDWHIWYRGCRFTLAMIHDRIWDCPFTLATMRYFRWNWNLPFYLAFVMFVPDPSYLPPTRGAVCDTAVIDFCLQRSGVSYLVFLIVWRGIIVPEWCSSAVGVLDLSGSVG